LLGFVIFGDTYGAKNFFDQGLRKVNGRIFFPNVVDSLLTQLGFNRFETNGNGERVMMKEWRMFETAKEEMPFWLFSKITADRAGVNDFWKVENDLKNHFSSTTDPENNNRDWNISVVNFVPETTKEVIIFNHFSNAINHIYVDRSLNEEEN
jgi:hypothetical protein